MLARGEWGEMQNRGSPWGMMGPLNLGGVPLKGHLSSPRGLSFGQLLALTSWISGLVTGQSYKPFPVKHVAVSPNPSKETDPLAFIAGAPDTWQTEGRTEHWPPRRRSQVPAVCAHPVGRVKTATADHVKSCDRDDSCPLKCVFPGHTHLWAFLSTMTCDYLIGICLPVAVSGTVQGTVASSPACSESRQCKVCCVTEK